MYSSRMRTTRSSSHGGGGGSFHQSTGMAFWCGGLLVWWLSVMAFWCGGPWCGGLLVWWPSVIAFSPRPYQKAALNQKATKPEGHNRRPPPRSRPPWEQTLPGADSSPETCCKACWDTTCNACWESTPEMMSVLSCALTLFWR